MTTSSQENCLYLTKKRKIFISVAKYNYEILFVSQPSNILRSFPNFSQDSQEMYPQIEIFLLYYILRQFSLKKLINEKIADTQQQNENIHMHGKI